MVVITVNNIHSKITGLKDVNLYDTLDRITSYYVEGYQYTKAFRTGWYDSKTGRFKNWDGKKHLITRTGTFPTGLLQRVVDFFVAHEIEYSIDDRRVEPTLGKPLAIKHYKPRDYQQEALDVAWKEGRGIIRIGTGGGKTMVSAMMLAKWNVPSMVYVVGKDLLYQFHEEMEKALGRKVGIIGDGKCDVRKFNVCSIWTAVKTFGLKSKVSLDDEDWAPEVFELGSAEKNKVKKAIESSVLSIYDEAHFLGTDTIQSIFKASKSCRYMFGLTGTDWREDGADLLLESVCGKRIYNMPSSILIEKGYLVQPKITMLEVPPWPESLPRNYQSIYNKYIVNNDIRNEMIVDATRKLIEKGRRPLVLVRYLSHGDTVALADGLSNYPIYFVNGEVDGETRKEVKREFENGDLKCLIASAVFDIGVNIPCLDALVLAGGGKSSVKTLQRIGRVIRTFDNKKDAIVVDFIDNALYLDKHSATRVAVYETEPMFRIKFPKGFDDAALKRPKKIQKKIGWA